MIVKNGTVESRILYCQICEAWMKHVRVTDGFICSCGEVVIIPSTKGGVDSLAKMLKKYDVKSTSHDVESRSNGNT